jgi:mRNA-decapping enzyme subunit 2
MAAPPIALSDALDELCMRFLNNLPASEYEEFERLFFAVEAAHWFYDDFHREENPRLPRLPLNAFAHKIFSHSPLLQPYVAEVDALTARFRTYKHGVPTFGAAMLVPDCTKVLLVQAWGKNAKWGFPKGKIAKDETELQAAAREVYEETGFDFMTVLDPASKEDPFFIDSYTGGKLCRIFVIPNVPEDTVFETRTRKEIGDIAWVPVTALPDPRQKSADDPPAGATGQHQQHSKIAWSPKSFWLVAQYVPKLRSYIKRRRKRDGPPPSQSALAQLTAAAPLQRPKKSSAVVQAKGRKERNDFASRDAETFGSDALVGDDNCGKGMTDGERDAFFRQYLADADRRKGELGIGDDLWPIPLVTSKDLPVLPASGSAPRGPAGTAPKPKAMLAGFRKGKAPPKLVPSATSVDGGTAVYTSANAPAMSTSVEDAVHRPRVRPLATKRPLVLDTTAQDSFRFDRAAVLACLS